MAIKRELIQFTIINGTDCDFTLPLFQQSVYSINATTKYSWDLTGEDFSCGDASLVINGVTVNLNFNPDITGLIISLNALGYGFFCTETVGPNTFLYVQDDTNVYGDLQICVASCVTTTTTTTSTTIAPTTSTTTSTTTAAPTTTTTSTTSSTTTAAPTTSTTTTTTTIAFVENFRSATPQLDVVTACAQTTPTSIYTSVPEDTMSVGITLYADSGLTTPFNGASQWFKIFWKGAIGFDDIYGVQISAAGLVEDFMFCSAITTTTTSTTSTTTAAPTTTTTSTTSSTTTAAPTTSTTTTTTTGGGGGFTAEIQVYAQDDGAGNYDIYAYVTAGTTADNLTFDGEYTFYSDGACTTPIGVACAWSGLVMPSGTSTPTAVNTTLCTKLGVVTGKVVTLTVNGNTITTNPETIIVGGNSYNIIAFNDCVPV